MRLAGARLDRLEPATLPRPAFLSAGAYEAPKDEVQLAFLTLPGPAPAIVPLENLQSTED